ncbi:ABC-2 family transporter [Streptomyces sp. 1114.5]|uniref:ABC transporter permease subunit n=1 Tax=unclassified Streptomyces TaxID=2593676 RepID=UPI000BD41AEF|nr:MULTISPECIES: ABC transporter permease subunit [unclassified Streptomyces]RKT18843.1 ABC-2 family transporter [Streptomyces sp. 1114.5]SOB85041.1 ABC-2 family transporter protein [Streptomyces sp. 1331.2]
MSATTIAPPRSAVLRAAGLRHRTTLVTLLAVMAAIALALLLHGWYVHDGLERSGAASCDPASEACLQKFKQFLHQYGGAGLQSLDLVLYVLGGAFGAFVGGPLLAREFEHGTVRFVWTQGVGRTRWTAGSLALAGGVVAVVAGLFGLLLRWWSSPLKLADGQFSEDLFAQTWPVMIGRVVLPFGVAALVGAVLRRTVVAVGTGLAVSVLLPYVAASFRFHYLQPLEEPVHSMRAMALDGRWLGEVWYSDPAGNRISVDEFYRHGDFGQLQALLRDGGYTAHQVYQPADRFWPFQFIEFGWMTALGLAACAAAVWWVRRRAA